MKGKNMTAIQPIIQTAYTDRGNEYKKSNAGKYVAGASVTGAGIVYGGKFAFKGAKSIYDKAKTIHMEIPEFLKNIKKSKSEIKETFIPKIKNAKQVLKKGKKGIRRHARKLKKQVSTTKNKNTKQIFGKIKNAFTKSVDFVKDTFKKISFANIKAKAESAVTFVKDNAKKLNMENFKKVKSTVIDFAKKPSTKYAAGVATGIAGVIALGVAADYIVNKVNEHRADKRA
jgi:hypothetical protein